MQTNMQAATPCDPGTDAADWPDMLSTVDLAQAPDLALLPDLAPASNGFVGNFEDASSLANDTDIAPARHASLSVADGRLNFTPSDLAYNAWYTDLYGVFLYRSVTGNFVAEANLNAGNEADASQAPTTQFSATGILAREATSFPPQPGSSHWVVYNSATRTTAWRANRS